MPIITPAYPSMCATYNITKSAMSIIQRELQRGCDITDSVMISKRPWSDLFVKHTFFTQGYKHYISVITASTTKEAHKIWSGYVESKVRVLVQGLEQHASIALAHAFNKGYDRRHMCASESEVSQVQEGSMDFLIKPNDTSAAVEVKPEPATAPTTETDGEAAQVPTDGQQSDDKPDEAPTKTEVFTTTHYIGLDLREGRFSRRTLPLLNHYTRQSCRCRHPAFSRSFPLPFEP